MTEPQNLTEALDADIQYTDAVKQLKDLHEKIRELQEEQLTRFWQIQALLRAADLCEVKRAEILGEDDEALLRSTGECSECWDSNWYSSKQAIFASVEGFCRQITEIGEKKDGVVTERDEVKSTVNSASQRVRRKFHAQQES